MKFDLLIKNGRVLDPAAGYDGQLDVAIQRERIVAVEHGIPDEAAVQVIDANGQLVTPGLVDLHTHVYYGATFWGINPEPIAARSGVTTWLDVGSAGAYNFPGLREFVIDRSAIRIYALLNISAIGLTAPTGEHRNLDYCDVDLCCQLIDLNRDLLLGVKARIDRNTTGASGLEPLLRARAAADRCELPLMVHIGVGPPDVAEVLAQLRPGDILTHCCTGGSMRLIDDNGALLEVARQAWESGVIMDIGHGAGSFSFESAEALGRAGRWPDVISSDIHQLSVHGPLFDLPTCLSKFLALGMPLLDVIRAATTRPAEVLGMAGELGTLRPGALADVALFDLHTGTFSLYDVYMNRREGGELLRNTLTILRGRPLRHTPDDPPMPWIELTPEQRSLRTNGHTPAAMAGKQRAESWYTLADIALARYRLTPYLSPTPLEPAPGLGKQVWLKLENTNRTHSFKIRGALNAVLALDGPARARGLLAASSGNHAQALACAAHLLSARARILMPAHTPRRKVAGVRSFGAEAVLFGDTYDEAEAEARRLEQRDGLTFVSPYNDASVVAGAGTIGLELLDTLPGLERVVVGAGGGGLLSGIATAVKAVRPAVEVVAVCAESAPAIYNLLSGTQLPQVWDTLAEALSGEIELGSLTIDITNRLADRAVLVSEAQIAAAMAWMLEEQGWLVEGGGAVGVAALLSGVLPADERPTAVIVSGGNVDLATLRAVLPAQANP